MHDAFRTVNEASGVFEPYEVDGRDAGEVLVLRSRSHEGDPLFVGLYRCAHEYSGAEQYDCDESMYIIAGDATVEVEGGTTLRLQAGDVATFQKGTKVSYNQSAGFKKFFVRSF